MTTAAFAWALEQGETASAHALPDPSELGWGNRALYHGSVGFDYALRTALATLLAGASLSAASGNWQRERKRLEFYEEFASVRDASVVFEPPPRVLVTTEAGRGLEAVGGRVELLRFDSPYCAFNPDLRDDYGRHANNAVARAQHWRREGGPRKTLCVVHGFGASPAWFNTAFFSLKDFFAEGWDILLYTLPFHGSRRGRTAPVNGIELFAHGMAHFNEAIIHAVHDFRILLDHLEHQGAPRFGVTGLSLGGYLSALLAAVEPRLDFSVPNAAVTWLPPLIGNWFPANVTSAALRALTGVSDEALARSLAVHSPLTYAPVVPKDRLMIVAGLGDRLAPPSQSTLLWEHWDHPELRWFPGSHVMHLGRGDYHGAMRALMDTEPEK